ncbi:MAG: FeoA family protein [Betaproteobacteria bacterium]|jgi:ferrous iron transport protein A
MNLNDLPVGQAQRVKSIGQLVDYPELTSQLEDIGFIPGEQVIILRKNSFGGDPIIVRIGLSTFAIRKKEASLIEVGI